MRRVLVVVCTAGAVLVLGASVSHACVGPACMNIWGTDADSGALTLDWDFAHKPVQTFKSFCAAGQCLYSAIDPGFRYEGAPAPDGYHTVADGTNVSVEIVAIDPVATLQVNGIPLRQPGDSALLGTTPALHNHPSWQLRLLQGEQGDYALSFKLTTDSPQYAESQVFQVTLTNLPTPTPDQPTATATPTPAPPACPGDCDGSGTVTISELIGGVSAALGSDTACRAFDLNGDGAVSIGELVAAVNAALTDCPAQPTPTATLPATLDSIQRTIFSPRCAIPTCHDAESQSGSLVLEAGSAYDQLVGVPPTVDTARSAGLLRVDAGHPENSFLLVKLTGPPPDRGSRMPLTGALLTDAQIQLIRDWIAQGGMR